MNITSIFTDEIIPPWLDTCLQGYITISFNDIIKKMGNPTIPHWKSTAHWCGMKILHKEEIDEVNTIVYTIYDYKDPDREHSVKSWQLYKWHVGGHDNRAIDVVKDLFPNYSVISKRI